MNELTELQVKLLRAASERDVNGELIPLKAIWLNGNCYICLNIFQENLIQANLKSETVEPLISNGFLEIASSNTAGKTLSLTTAGANVLGKYDNKQAVTDHQ